MSYTADPPSLPDVELTVTLHGHALEPNKWMEVEKRVAEAVARELGVQATAVWEPPF